MSEDLIETFRRTAGDPLMFENLLEHWNAAFDEPDANPVTPALELAADQAMLEFTARDSSELVG